MQQFPPRRKRVWLLGIALALVFATFWAAGSGLAEPPIRLMINGRLIHSDVAPLVVSGRVLVPLRTVAEELGAEVAYDEPTRMVSVSSSATAAAPAPVSSDPVAAALLPAGGSLADVVAMVQPSVVTVVGLEQSYGGTYVSGWGSGVVISADGLILTNAHVVEGLHRVVVVTADRRRLEVERIWSDNFAGVTSDVAVLKVAASGLTPARLGRSDDMRVGDVVFAVGTPYELHLQSTVTMGIISGKVRWDGLGYYPFLQTDASINHGNSGGALVNTRGEVVGIPTLKVVEEGFQGLGFAIPIDVALRIKDQLLQHGRVIRPWLGIMVSESADAQMGLPSDEGLRVTTVVPDSPSQQAGLRVGDIITHIGGQKVSTRGEIYEILFGQEVGSLVRMDIIRNDRPISVQVRLAERPD